MAQLQVWVWKLAQKCTGQINKANSSQLQDNYLSLRLQALQTSKYDFDMYLSKEKKAEIFAEYGASATDTGSAEGQIALFSFRINHLTGHLKQNRKDHNTERSLIALVGKRRKLLNYLKKTDIARYRAIIEKLGLRK